MCDVSFEIGFRVLCSIGGWGFVEWMKFGYRVLGVLVFFLFINIVLGGISVIWLEVL